MGGRPTLRGILAATLLVGVIAIVYVPDLRQKIVSSVKPVASVTPETAEGGQDDNVDIIAKQRNETSHSTFGVGPMPVCASKWGHFHRNKTLLTETQVIRRGPPQIDNRTFMHDKSFDSFVFDPDTNFAFCAIEKNACSQWLTVLQNVIGKHTSNGANGPAYYLAGQCQKRFGKERLKDILESPNSTVAVMVRDPLARFASVYLNKCFDANCTSGFCLPRVHQKLPKGEPISFRQALDWILQADVSAIDGHYKLQSVRCGIQNGGLEKYFTIVGRITKETLSTDADCLMEYANISQYNIPSAKSVRERNISSQATFWSKGAGAANIKYRPEKEEDVLKKLFTPEAARKLMDKFRSDYNTFQLPEPEWIDDATGEWMDSLDHHSCKKPLGRGGTGRV